MSKNTFLTDIAIIRENARKNLSKGSVTNGYKLDANKVIELLNCALATEKVCALRYEKHYYNATAQGASIAATEFLEHAKQETAHAESLAQRIAQLGGSPDLDPANLLQRSHSEYVDCHDLKEMIKENLIAERVAIDTYREMIDFVGNADPTTRVLLEGILAVEEEHADDLIEVGAEYNISFD